MSTLTDFYTFEAEPWADYEGTGYMIRLDGPSIDARRISRHPDRTPEEIWIWLLGARIAVVRAPAAAGSEVTLIRDPLKDWVDPAEADALVAQVRAGFGLGGGG